MPRTGIAYRLGVRAAGVLEPLAGLISSKARAGSRGRRGALDRLRAWGNEHRDPERPLVWFHASSVGEGLQAAAVLTRLRTDHPDWQFAYTHFSPSAESFAEGLGVDVADYLPWDTPGQVEALLEALKPSAIVFAKLDLWAELATAADGAGIPVMLIAGTVRPNSSRLGWPAREINRPGYAALSRAGAVGENDARRLQYLGVRAGVITLTGDPRFDSVEDRIKAHGEDDPYRALCRGSNTIVAGSTWPGDEDVLLEAFARLEIRHASARLVLVPHEPTPSHVKRILSVAHRHGLREPVLFSDWTGVETGKVVVVDRVGILSRLYPAASMAYVGGGFHGAGLHSVLEPAACGIPVVFGPQWTESRDAHLLLEAGGAESLAEFGTREAAEQLQNLWEEWIEDPDRRVSQGWKAREVVEAGLGAAERSAEMVEATLGTRTANR